MISRTRKRPGRPGFTLAELLVVVLILAVLVSLITAAVFRFIGGQSERNTETMLHKLHDGVQQQWSEASKEIKLSTPPLSVQGLAGGDMALAQVIWLKLRLRREFPMSYDEILQPWGTYSSLQSDLPQIPSYVAALNGRTTANDRTTESSACLLIALQNHPHKGMKFNAEESLGASAIKDTDGDGVPEIIDGYGNPIAFFRWGTQAYAVNPPPGVSLDGLAKNVGSSNRDRDVEDPTHKLMDANWQTNYSGSVTTFQNLCHRIQDPANGQPRSYFTIPVVVSAGKDGDFGLVLPYQQSTAAYLADMKPTSTKADDNLYSFTLR
jgi:prepilin-type N-terminal cleavage/methylation domain-containing protein